MSDVIRRLASARLMEEPASASSACLTMRCTAACSACPSHTMAKGDKWAANTTPDPEGSKERKTWSTSLVDARGAEARVRGAMEAMSRAWICELMMA